MVMFKMIARFFPSYADHRPKINAVILLDIAHTLRGEHALEE
jgi:hypothetical protein